MKSLEIDETPVRSSGPSCGNNLSLTLEGDYQ